MSDNSKLTTKERRSLSNLIDTVRRGMSTFMEVGNALAEIKAKQLYRETHKTFAGFCESEFDMRRQHAYRLIDSAKIIDVLSPIGDILPATETQARPLTAIPVEKVGEVWRQVVDKAPKGKDGQPAITAKLVEEEAAPYRAKRQKAEPTFDHVKALDRVYLWVTERAEEWPEGEREPLSKILIQLSKEVL